VSHTRPSTPGVFLPSLFVTRCPARALPLNEWGQEVLQGTDLAPSSRLHCLHNTRLEPPHRPVDGIPVNGVPGPRASGERTSQCCHRCHLPSLFQKLAKLSGDARPDGRLPACAWGDMARALNP